MSDALFSALELADGSDLRAGYRLHRVEIYNWGTFDKYVWELEPDGSTSLLTGDIGSGKSTLVDAITTLLLPASKISYNKAAGADSKERNLRSYIQGHYRSERNEVTGTSKPVGLRDSSAYSVILGVFKNEGYDESVTLAQFFHLKDDKAQPYRFFVTAETELSVAEDFSNFGVDSRKLRAVLRDKGAQVDDAYSDYARRLRRLLGIKSEQAMELFHQTVSMKSVGNLGDFVRTHMLEPISVERKISAVIKHFEDLYQAHESLKKAEHQLSILDPLTESAARFDNAGAEHDGYVLQRDAINLFVAQQTLLLIVKLKGEIAAKLQSEEAAAAESVKQNDALETRSQNLREERSGAGGNRLGTIERERDSLTALQKERTERRARFEVHVTDAGLQGAQSFDEFVSLKSAAVKKALVTAEERGILDKKRFGFLERSAGLRTKIAELDEELLSLKNRKNNLPQMLVQTRQMLLETLNISEADLPFAGELIDVRSENQMWRGAVERVLRGFATTLLVPEKHASRVATLINRTNLGTRLVYLRVPERQMQVKFAKSDAELKLNQILEIEPGSFADFVQSELAHRADFVLVQDAKELQVYDRAVTVNGLIRDRMRHEKDDRHAINDPRRWVLGRSTAGKIIAITEELNELKLTQAELSENGDKVVRQVAALDKQLNAFAKLEEYLSWQDIDHDSLTEKIAELVAEHERILAGSKRLTEIDELLAEIAEKLKTNRAAQAKIIERIGALKHELQRFEEREITEKLLLQQASPEEILRADEQSDQLLARVGKKAPASLDDITQLQTRLVREVSQAILDKQREMNGYSTHIQKLMLDMLAQWPELASDLDAKMESIADFRRMHAQVKEDDLPRHESEFKRLLNTETVRELAGFNNWLHRQANEIAGRVETINEALAAIDYNPGRVIRLTNDATRNQDVRQFKADMREATGDLLDDGDDLDLRFERVKAIIERFKGRPGYSDIDKNWRQRVTDVRNWFNFAAEERDRETGEVFEHYTDSDGKSGGQKEKLAYTILAASLAYQFGLEWGVKHSKDFRFVVIDEAFGRGSDASTRYALELFAKLGLQLLIVTPLQKVHVIEPYVQSIGYVDNPDGSASRVSTLTISEYKKLEQRQGV